MVVTVGFFDGVHLGHRRVLRSLLEKGESVAAVTFWPHPRVVLQQDVRGFSLLSTIEEKTALIRSAGIEDIRCIEFTRDFAAMTASEFISDYLIGQMGCTCLVLGYDNRLGSDGLDTQEIADLGRKFGLEVEIVPHLEVEGLPVSSTRIRNALLDGDVALAERMLGYRYCYKGTVIAGNGLGRSLGYPAASIAPLYPLKTVPGNGVYAVEVGVQGRNFRGMTFIGEHPTMGEGLPRVIETNIFDFDEEIYGMEIELRFISKVRHEMRFPSVEDLAKQLLVDRHRCYGCN